MKKKLFFCLFIFFVIHFSCISFEIDFANSEMKAIYDAQKFFDSNDFGNAMSYCEKARSLRKTKIEWELKCLNNSFKSYELKRYGDSISLSLDRLKERQDYDTLNIIDYYFERWGKERFFDSKKKFIEFIERRSNFPEAEYLTGKIFQVEGEYDIALSFYKKALEYDYNLDIPMQKFEILYSISEISFLNKNFDQYEIDLLQIVSQDENFKKSNLKKAIKNTISNVKSDCVDKFFKLYRNENYTVLKAYCKLAELYDSMNENERYLECVSMGTLTGFTKILDVISKRDPEWEYKNLETLLAECALYEDIVQWGKENSLWKSYYMLGCASYKCESPIFAKNLFQILEKSLPDEYWKKACSLKLKEIVVK